jgi:hypothetical protein
MRVKQKDGLKEKKKAEKKAEKKVKLHFNGRVTKFAREKSLFWTRCQDRFDDRIVKDENCLDKINQYITNNPIVWHKEGYYQR